MNNLDYYAIGLRIRKYRKACNLSQEQLAEKVGISPTHASHIETANTKLSLPVLAAIADMLGVRVDDILHEHNDLQTDKRLLRDEIMTLLADCSADDTHILLDIIRASKTALDKYRTPGQH